MGPASTRYDVVIIGAGICGLNALFVATEHLKRGGRVALVDRRLGPGGMWNDTYDYVRLHQPHPFFTAGDLKWQWDKDPTHLATKSEVLDHMRYCLKTIEERAEVVEWFGWDYVEHDEAAGVVWTVLERDGEQVTLESTRLVKALGLNVKTNDPLPLTSSRVHSVSPDTYDVRAGELAASTAPVWVIGGGKTAMDTIHTLVTANPDREVDLVAGSGTWFVRRDEMYDAAHGWRRGTRVNKHAERVAMAYDGTNEAAVFAAANGDAFTKVTPTAANYMIGILSDAEAARIRTGLTSTLMDHLVDAVDTDDGVELVLRSGERVPVPTGSWVVNCTGYLLNRDRPYEPFCSASGRVLSINQRSDALLFSHMAGYLLTHALMRGKLARLPLYELDSLELRRAGGSATTLAIWTMLMHNFTVLARSLPPTVFLHNGLDGDRWYPALRRLTGLLEFIGTSSRQRAHYRATAAVVRERYGVRFGPLDHAG